MPVKIENTMAMAPAVYPTAFWTYGLAAIRSMRSIAVRNCQATAYAARSGGRRNQPRMPLKSDEMLHELEGLGFVNVDVGAF